MQEFKLKIWRNDGAGDWSIEINGLRHEHITSAVLEALAECALVVAQQALSKAATRLPQ